MAKKKKIAPCDNCPWRTDAPLRYWDDEHFRSIWSSCQDDGLALMLCHKSKPNEGLELPCAGAILVVGFDAIGLRIAAIQGRVNPNEYSANGIELYPDFKAMLRANEIEVPKRNRLIPDKE